MKNTFLYALHMADNALLLAQRNSEWTGHGPVLEQDIAITNIALDLIGQARNLYSHAAALYNGFDEEEKAAVENFLPQPWKSYGRELQEDDLAFLRDERQYLNFLLVELPRGDWAFSILRQFLFSAYQFFLYQKLQQSSDAQLQAIAEKSSKEVTYHLRWSGEWVIRLGDGTEESHRRLKAALDELWPFVSEMFQASEYDEVNAASLQNDWLKKMQSVFDEAALPSPLSGPHPSAGWRTPSPKEKENGKQTFVGEGKRVRSRQHTEHLAPLLAEMQGLQRTYPNVIW